MEKPDLDQEIASDATPHDLLHRLWGKAVGTPHYVKAEWRRLEALLRSVDVPAGAPHNTHIPVGIGHAGRRAIGDKANELVVATGISWEDALALLNG